MAPFLQRDYYRNTRCVRPLLVGLMHALFVFYLLMVNLVIFKPAQRDITLYLFVWEKIISQLMAFRRNARALRSDGPREREGKDE